MKPKILNGLTRVQRKSVERSRGTESGIERLHGPYEHRMYFYGIESRIERLHGPDEHRMYFYQIFQFELVLPEGGQLNKTLFKIRKKCMVHPENQTLK